MDEDHHRVPHPHHQLHLPHHHHHHHHHHQHAGGAGSGGAASVQPLPDAAASAAAAAGHQQQQHHLTLSLPVHHSAAAPLRALKQQQQQQQQQGLDGMERSGGVTGGGAGGAGHGRDDCWSEGATFTLIEAWGERYLELNRGNLKQKHWKDVADAVNSREEGTKSAKTDVQCKNRLDTLKKKYKLEKGRLIAEGGGGGGGGGGSKWPFYVKLDELIGPSRKGKKQLGKVKKKERRGGAEDHQLQHTNNNNTNISGSSNSNKSRESPDMTDSSPQGNGLLLEGKSSMKKRKLQDGPFKDLARAIVKFGEVYERIETAKQQALVELEKQRMEFTKDMELQRMQLFMQTQVELAKMKHAKHGSTEHYL